MLGTERVIGQRGPARCCGASELASRQMSFYCSLCRKLCESCALFLKKIQLLFPPAPCVCLCVVGRRYACEGQRKCFMPRFSVSSFGV